MKTKKLKKKNIELNKNNKKQKNANHNDKKINLCKSEYQYDMWPGFINN